MENQTLTKAEFNFKIQKPLNLFLGGICALLCVCIAIYESLLSAVTTDKWIALFLGCTNFLVCFISAFSLIVPKYSEIVQALYIVLQCTLAIITTKMESSASKYSEQESTSDLKLDVRARLRQINITCILFFNMAYSPFFVNIKTYTIVSMFAVLGFIGTQFLIENSFYS